MFIANVSAVLMLVSDAPIAFGTYVTLARIGIILELSHVVEGGSAVSAASSMHSTAEAVMIGCLFCVDLGVSPPSTAIKRGESVCEIKFAVGANSGRIRGLVYWPRLRVPAAMYRWISSCTFQGSVIFRGGLCRQ